MVNLEPQGYFDGDEILWEIEKSVKGNEAPLPDDKPPTATQYDGGEQAKGVLQAFEGRQCTDVDGRGVRRRTQLLGRFNGGFWATQNRGRRTVAMVSAEGVDE